MHRDRRNAMYNIVNKAWKRMRSGDRPGLQNRRVASSGVTGGFDPHSLPPHKTRVITGVLHFSAIDCARYCASLKA